MFRTHPLLALGLVALLALFPACSSDDGGSPTGPGSDDPNTTTGIDLSSYRELVEQAAPPAYQALARGHSDWTSGDYPILGKVFSEDEPMSLYWNIQTLDDVIASIEEAMAEWERPADPDSAAADSSGAGEEVVENSGGECIVERCEGPTAMQGFAAGLLGRELDLQYRMDITVDALPTQELQFGFSQSETEETVVAFHAYDYPNDAPESRDSFVFYGHRDLVTGEGIVRGVFAKTDVETQQMDKWVYEFRVVGDGEFRYRMAWYAPDPAFVASLIGGGDKDVEFALRYQQRNGPTFDSVDPDDPWGHLTQVFGPDFSDGGSIFDAAHEALCPEDQMFWFGDMPAGLLTSPFGEALTQ